MKNVARRSLGAYWPGKKGSRSIPGIVSKKLRDSVSQGLTGGTLRVFGGQKLLNGLFDASNTLFQPGQLPPGIGKKLLRLGSQLLQVRPVFVLQYLPFEQ